MGILAKQDLIKVSLPIKEEPTFLPSNPLNHLVYHRLNVPSPQPAVVERHPKVLKRKLTFLTIKNLGHVILSFLLQTNQSWSDYFYHN